MPLPVGAASSTPVAWAASGERVAAARARSEVNVRIFMVPSPVPRSVKGSPTRSASIGVASFWSKLAYFATNASRDADLGKARLFRPRATAFGGGRGGPRRRPAHPPVSGRGREPRAAHALLAPGPGVGARGGRLDRPQRCPAERADTGPGQSGGSSGARDLALPWLARVGARARRSHPARHGAAGRVCQRAGAERAQQLRQRERGGAAAGLERALRGAATHRRADARLAQGAAGDGRADVLVRFTARRYPRARAIRGELAARSLAGEGRSGEGPRSLVALATTVGARQVCDFGGARRRAVARGQPPLASPHRRAARRPRARVARGRLLVVCGTGSSGGRRRHFTRPSRGRPADLRLGRATGRGRAGRGRASAGADSADRRFFPRSLIEIAGIAGRWYAPRRLPPNFVSLLLIALLLFLLFGGDRIGSVGRGLGEAA